MITECENDPEECDPYPKCMRKKHCYNVTLVTLTSVTLNLMSSVAII